MDDLISRQVAIDAIEDEWNGCCSEYTPSEIIHETVLRIEQLPSAQLEIIYCKDCRKHNKKVGFDENFHTVWKEDACPLVSWRGKAQGHEFDYQYCAFAERRTDG